MIHIVKEEIIEEDGLKYKVEKYDNGAVVKSLYSDEPIEPEPRLEPELSATEQAILETQANAEYLVALSELA